MTKLLATLIIGAFSAAAFASTPATSATPAATPAKAEAKAEAEKMVSSAQALADHLRLEAKKIAEKTKQNLQNAMLEANIETRPLWKPMHLQPIFKDLPYYGNNESEKLFNKGLCLPSGSNLTDDDRDRIFNVVSKF